MQHVVENQELSGSIKLKPGINKFINCWAAPGAPPAIDCGGEGQILELHNYAGDVGLFNKTGPEPVRIDLSSGSVTLDSTVEGGRVTVRGVGRLYNHGYCMVDARGLVEAFYGM